VSLSHDFGVWVAALLTLCVFSFLYKDNPLYKLAEHLYLGVSIGVGIVEIYYGSFKPNIIDKLRDGELLPIIPLALIVLLFLKLSTRIGWVARIPIAKAKELLLKQGIPVRPGLADATEGTRIQATGESNGGRSLPAAQPDRSKPGGRQ